VTAYTARLVEILGTRGVGRAHPVPTKTLAGQLGVQARVIGELVAEAIEEGALIGSTCNGSRAGYFIVRDWEDLTAGTSTSGAALSGASGASVCSAGCRTTVQ
jgi:hypothetical protein